MVYEHILEFQNLLLVSFEIGTHLDRQDYYVCLAKVQLIRRCKSDPAIFRFGRKHWKRLRR